MISPKNIICHANSLENTKKSLKLFRSESGASEIIMYIMYLVILCKYSTSEPWPCAMELLKTFLKLSINF